MEYRKFGSTYILRIDRGEEILASITTLCNAEKIRLGSVSGIGAVGEVTLGVFNREKFAYESTTYTGDPAPAPSPPRRGRRTSTSIWRSEMP